MIESVRARNSCTVFKVSGRLMSSGIDPLAEARDWVSGRLSFIDRVNSIIVLGVGSGYHIAELLVRTTANICVVDVHSDLIEQTKKIHRFDSDRVRFVSCVNSKDLRSSDNIRKAITTSFIVLQHAPSVALMPDLYSEFFSQLLGRDWGTLNWQWRLKGFAPLESQPKIFSQAEPLSILDLEKTEFVQDSEERERMLVKALRELVK